MHQPILVVGTKSGGRAGRRWAESRESQESGIERASKPNCAGSCHINDYGRGYVIYCDPILVRRLSEINASLEVVVHPGTDPETTKAGVVDLGHLPEED